LEHILPRAQHSEFKIRCAMSIPANSMTNSFIYKIILKIQT